jgi:phosphatidylinositol glycan class T
MFLIKSLFSELKHYKPARDRKRPHYYEIGFDLPASHGSCELSIKFDRVLLRYSEYPPDAHHGFPIAGPMITFYNPSVANYTLILDGMEQLLTFSR